MDSFTPGSYATFPLTHFDRLFERTTFLTGWLVEGAIDTDAVAKALVNVTRKWRMLSGRLESIKDEDDVTEWRIKIPLGVIPADYKTFALTTSTSEFPLSHYIETPLPLVSRSLPHALFIHSSTPRQYSLWESRSHPLTCWHITHLPPDPSIGGQEHTCIGFARSHGIFDGIGAGAIMRALVCEIKGEEWSPPSLPLSGYSANIMQKAFDMQRQAYNDCGGTLPEGYYGFTNLGVGGAAKQIGWHMRERWWHGADRRILLMPKDVLSTLVTNVRAELSHHSVDASVEVTTGDILVAWVLKTAYSMGTSTETIIHCANMASFRTLLSQDDSSILQYPHNAFIPLPYPSLTVSELQRLSLRELSHKLAVSRTSMAISHVISSYNALDSVTAFPANPTADETVVVSNVSASRILESDWSPVGGSRTLCGYRYQLTPTELMMTNSVYIAGRLGDGSVVLDICLRKSRVDLLADAILRLKGSGDVFD